jgi:hypothetical protein
MNTVEVGAKPGIEMAQIPFAYLSFEFVEDMIQQ